MGSARLVAPLRAPSVYPVAIVDQFAGAVVEGGDLRLGGRRDQSVWRRGECRSNMRGGDIRITLSGDRRRCRRERHGHGPSDLRRPNALDRKIGRGSWRAWVSLGSLELPSDGDGHDAVADGLAVAQHGPHAQSRRQANGGSTETVS